MVFRQNCIKLHAKFSYFFFIIFFSIKYDFHLNLKAICEEGTELNSTKETCEPCSIGFYKDVSANDVSVNKTDRFECKRCPGNLTTYSIKSTDISDCIGTCFIFQMMNTSGGGGVVLGGFLLSLCVFHNHYNSNLNCY